jgi:hypothetical protein
MNPEQSNVERRAAQRFSFHLPVTIRLTASSRQGSGFTQDLSARGALLYTDLMLSVDDEVEFTVTMPSEITLSESMPVCCKGKVTRVTPLEGKYAVAVHIETYEYLPNPHNSAQTSASFARISALHAHHEEEKNQQVKALA